MGNSNYNPYQATFYPVTTTRDPPSKSTAVMVLGGGQAPDSAHANAHPLPGDRPGGHRPSCLGVLL